MFENIHRLSSGKPVAIFGTGSSGSAAKKLLDAIGIKSVMYAENGAGAKSDFTAIDARNHALAVYSPAFRPDHKWLCAARAEGVKTICETDLSALAWSGKIVAITGTNGKTTLTSFVTHLLNRAGFDAIAAGNIGDPLSGFCFEYGGDKNKIAVCELSSFQTSALEFLRPDALLWTNFAPDHLDWHKDMREYFTAKHNLVKAMRGELFIAGSSVAHSAASFDIILPKFAKILDEENPPSAPEPFGSSIQARNFDMAINFAESFGVDGATVRAAAADFKLPAHRFSRPIISRGVRFFNDSKATNAHAAIAALKELKNEKHLVWLGGGKNKHCDISPLVDAVSESAKAAVLIGQTAEMLKEVLDKKLPQGAHVCSSMEDAVGRAFALSKEDSAVLFSPGFSSFGMFSGYADRGKSFENSVLCLKNLK